MERMNSAENFREKDPGEDLRENQERIQNGGYGNPEGMGVAESFKDVSNQWLDLLEYGADVLEMNEEETAKHQDQMQRLLQGKLNESEMDEIVDRLARFEEKRAQQKEETFH